MGSAPRPKMSHSSTSPEAIVAIATPPGRGGIGVIRLSGGDLTFVMNALLGKRIEPRYSYYGPFLAEDDSVMDRGLAFFYPGPNSFTGENVLELQAHGSPVVLDLLLRRVLSLNVRLARPGEFTERAFLNGKIDLAQAEAIADLIDASTEQAAKSAQRALEGAFSREVNRLVEGLIELRLFVEASIDFTDEDIDFLEEARISEQLELLQQDLALIHSSARQGTLLREGMKIVIVGRPNAGKSSLLNSMARKDIAIVSDIPGTTRDTVREHIHIEGMPIHIIDTAGLRDTQDPIELEGIRRAHSEMDSCDRVLLIIDALQADPIEEEDLLKTLPSNIAVTRVYNKIDITGHPPESKTKEGETSIYLSAKSGDGMDLLFSHLKACIGYKGDSEDTFIARRRHLDAIRRALGAIESAQLNLSQGQLELLAEELTEAQNAMSEITGAFTSDDLLGRIFSSFCIGK